MQAKELMISDLVLLKSNGVVPDSNVKVIEIAQDGLFVEDCDNLIGYNEIVPMQLTEDILIANRFVCNDKGTKGKRYVCGGNEFFVEVYFFDGMCNCFNARRSYFLGDEYVMDRAHKCGWCVHELQQTLRLVGLREMADNFKIEQE